MIRHSNRKLKPIVIEKHHDLINRRYDNYEKLIVFHEEYNFIEMVLLNRFKNNDGKYIKIIVYRKRNNKWKFSGKISVYSQKEVNNLIGALQKIWEEMIEKYV
ncbi:MAG: hypothetical protein ACTSPY_04100 [Candidatus Helarchaeota archaeon]